MNVEDTQEYVVRLKKECIFQGKFLMRQKLW